MEEWVDGGMGGWMEECTSTARRRRPPHSLFMSHRPPCCFDSSVTHYSSVFVGEFVALQA